jgi:hypothetical protein
MVLDLQGRATVLFPFKMDQADALTVLDGSRVWIGRLARFGIKWIAKSRVVPT